MSVTLLPKPERKPTASVGADLLASGSGSGAGADGAARLLAAAPAGVERERTHRSIEPVVATTKRTMTVTQ